MTISLPLSKSLVGEGISDKAARGDSEIWPKGECELAEATNNRLVEYGASSTHVRQSGEFRGFSGLAKR